MGTYEWALAFALSNGGVWDTEFRFATYEECYEYTVLETGNEGPINDCKISDGRAILKSCVEAITKDSRALCLPIKTNSDAD